VYTDESYCKIKLLEYSFFGPLCIHMDQSNRRLPPPPLYRQSVNHILPSALTVIIISPEADTDVEHNTVVLLLLVKLFYFLPTPGG